jgi:hypothetical protein
VGKRVSGCNRGGENATIAGVDKCARHGSKSDELTGPIRLFAFVSVVLKVALFYRRQLDPNAREVDA